MKKWLLAIFAITVLFVLAACGAEEEANEASVAGAETETLTIEHKLGEATFEQNPEKVVVFDFGVLDTLDALEVEVAGVPQMLIPEYLEKYNGEEYTNAGSLKEPDFEAIHALDPDLIIISARQAELYEEFTDIAPTLYVELDTANYMESFESNMTLLGEVFGKEAEVEEQLAAIDSRIAEVQELAAASEEKALVVLANEGKVSAYGPASRFGWIHDVLGVAAVDESIEVSTHGQSITFEYILERNPDTLFVIDRTAAVGGEIGAKETIENELVKKTNAYQNDGIVYLDPDFWYLSGGGLQSVSQMVEDVASAIQ
ncbi:siderophore ABC transporter substrate-binding protein [Planococcus lenghuensis]|uniref:ABC transporter n=1 Tax=Planococcus lenghuensis TaxID=2213202 RepID=A0A1Q2KV22_9BACL|nr:siderophore ABC transporter substrate-binding protein [Planococcus lenghuensis]AQQ52065.1 ABC transporter [Planococcus lenghuensis]